MDPENIPSILKTLGQTVENRLADAMRGREDKDDTTARQREPEPMPRWRSENGMDYEPDWDDLDRKANLIIARYTVISTAANVLPFGLDIVAVTGTFTKMTTELAGVYQVIVTNKRARQMGWAIASTTGTVLGTVYGASRLAKLIPGSYFFGVLVQAPIVGAVAWAAGDALKGYFKETRMGREPSIDSLRDSFARTLRLNLTRSKKVKTPKAADTAAAGTAAVKTGAPASVNGSGVGSGSGAEENLTAGDIVEKIASLHELLRAGAITQAEFDRKKSELLSRM